MNVSSALSTVGALDWDHHADGCDCGFWCNLGFSGQADGD